MVFEGFDSLGVCYDFDIDQRNNLFYTKCQVNDKWCALKIDGGSCRNLVSIEMVSKLGLSVVDHPKPYDLYGLIMEDCFRVSKQVRVGLAMGSYIDEITFDVVSMNDCHVLLGRPWLYDLDVIHHGRVNEYEFGFNGKVIVLKPMSSKAVFEMLEKLKPVIDVFDNSPVVDETKGEVTDLEIDSEIFSDVVFDSNMDLEDDTWKPVWDDELTSLDNPLISIDNINSEIDLSVANGVVKDSDFIGDVGLQDGDLKESHSIDPNMILTCHIESKDSGFSKATLGLLEKLIWVISILHNWFYMLVFDRLFEVVVHLLGWLRKRISEFYFSWKPPPLMGLNIFKRKRVMGYSGCSIVFTVFQSYHDLVVWKWFIRDEPKVSRVINKNLETRLWNVGACGFNLFRVGLKVNRFEWVKHTWRKFLNFGVATIRVWFWGFTNLLKLKEVGLCFGLINSRLGGSSFSTSYGVCVFGADWISKVDPRSKGSAVIKWVGSKLLNANHN